MPLAPLIVGNWKMHGTEAEAARLVRRIARGARRIAGVQIAVAPPFTALAKARALLRGSRLLLAAQDVHWEDSGAFTGEISPPMLSDLGCRLVIVGHSERRHLFHESDDAVAKKLAACLRWRLRPILCIGETLDERRSGATFRVLGRQLRAALKGLRESAIGNIDIAYEPVWAIGTGQNATPEQVSAVHRWIRERLVGPSAPARSPCRILYGGSVRPDNAAELAALREVGGLLVGGASLQAESFLAIARTLAEARAR
jgi:triosephosphate isomerase